MNIACQKTPSRSLVPGSLAGLIALCLALLLLGLVPLAGARARDHAEVSDRVGLFNTIDVHGNEEVGDIACMFCTVNLDGDVRGDIAVMFGTVNGASDRTISGDVAVLFSTLRLGSDTHVHGDMATALSTVQLAPGVVIDGDKAVFSSGLGATVILAPLLLLAGFIWLMVWLIRRIMYPRF